jgi:hypothetical protein
MITSKTRFSVAALACAWIGLTGCDGGWPLNAKAALEAARATPTSADTADTAPDKTTEPTPPTKPDGTTSCDKPQESAPEPTECKVATDASGAPCKVCFGASGKILYDGCGSGGGSGGGGGSEGGASVKCESFEDPAKGVLCKRCYAADGTVTASDCVPVAPAPPGNALSCTAKTDEATGQVCKVCSDESGKVAFTDCVPSGAAPGPDETPPPKK